MSKLVIESRLRKLVEKQLQNVPNDFRQLQSLQDHGFRSTNRENCCNTNDGIYTCYIDMVVAFDAIIRSKI